MNYPKLAEELASDPVSVGYPGDAQLAADAGNAVSRTVFLDQIDGPVLWDLVDPGEYGALSPDNAAKIDDIIALGEGIQIGNNSRARDDFLAIFGGGTATRAAVFTFIQRLVSRFEEIGITSDGMNKPVPAQDIIIARAL